MSVPTKRSPLALAALASAAVPDLDPVSVEQVRTEPTSRFDVAFVQDAEHRRWVIRCPRTPAASAQLEQSAALTHLVSRRLQLSVPVVRGWVALPEGGRAAVHAQISGRLLDLERLVPGPGLTASLGRAVASVHNLDPAVFEEAGTPSYEPEAYRTRRLADLDRAAATGRVPTGLLTRWERQLEDVGLWRYQPVPTIGGLGGERVLATEDDDQQLSVRGFVGWEDAQVADPADDLAAVVGSVDEETLDTFMEAYAHTRVHRPDRGLVRRARLVHEMSLVRSMMSAVATGDLDLAEEHAAALRRLDAEVADAPDAPAVTDVTDAAQASDAPAVTDASDVAQASDAPEASEATDAAEATGGPGASDDVGAGGDEGEEDPSTPETASGGSTSASLVGSRRDEGAEVSADDDAAAADGDETRSEEQPEQPDNVAEGGAAGEQPDGVAEGGAGEQPGDVTPPRR